MRFDAAPRPGGNMEKGGDPPKPAWRRPLQGMKRLSRKFGQSAAEGRKTFVKPDAGRGSLPTFSRQNIFRCGILPPWQAGRQKKKTGPTVRVGPALMRYFYPVCGGRGKPPGSVQHAVLLIVYRLQPLVAGLLAGDFHGQVSRAAPCQCLTPAGITTTSPVCSSRAGWPHS